MTKSGRDGIGGIVFDAVGTLIDPAPPVAEVYAAAARRQGIDLDPAVVKARFHRHFRNDEVDEARGPMVTDEGLEFRRWRRIVGSVLPEVPDPDRAFEELWGHFGKPDAWRCDPDVGPALRMLDERGVPVVIASNFDGRLRQVIAGLREIVGRVQALVISSEVGYRKPHPAFYQAVCDSLGLPAGRIVWVGDDAENDVRGPTRAGMTGLLLDRHGNRPGDVPHLPGLDALGGWIGP